MAKLMCHFCRRYFPMTALVEVDVEDYEEALWVRVDACHSCAKAHAESLTSGD